MALLERRAGEIVIEILALEDVGEHASRFQYRRTVVRHTPCRGANIAANARYTIGIGRRNQRRKICPFIDSNHYLTTVRYPARSRLPRPPVQSRRHLRGRRARYLVSRARPPAWRGAGAQRDRAWAFGRGRYPRLSRPRFRTDEPSLAQPRGRSTDRDHGAGGRCAPPRREADARGPARVRGLRGADEHAGRRLSRPPFATGGVAGGDGLDRLRADARPDRAERNRPAQRRLALLPRRVLCRARPPLQTRIRRLALARSRCGGHGSTARNVRRRDVGHAADRLRRPEGNGSRLRGDQAAVGGTRRARTAARPAL